MWGLRVWRAAPLRRVFTNAHPEPSQWFRRRCQPTPPSQPAPGATSLARRFTAGRGGAPDEGDSQGCKSTPASRQETQHPNGSRFAFSRSRALKGRKAARRRSGFSVAFGVRRTLRERIHTGRHHPARSPPLRRPYADRNATLVLRVPSCRAWPARAGLLLSQWSHCKKVYRVQRSLLFVPEIF
jgi:hypothetical protein